MLSSLIFCSGGARAQAQSATPPVEQSMEDFSFYGVGDKGKKNWDLAGKSADIGSEVIKLNDIVSNFYGEKDTVKLTAEKGAFNRTAGNLHLQDEVVVTSTSGARLTTDSLDWDRKNQLVTTPDKVNITREDMVITGQGAQGFPDLNKVNLNKNVQVDIGASAANKTQQQKERITITCDGSLQIDYEKNLATFNTNVQVQTRDALMKSDSMEVYFVPEKDSTAPESASLSAAAAQSRIDKIIARGNVSITQGENVSYSEEAVYSAQERRILLQGRPKVVFYTAEGLHAPAGN